MSYVFRPARPWPKAIWPVVIGLIVVAATAGCLLSSSSCKHQILPGSASPHEQMVAAWQIEVAGEQRYGQSFSGRYFPDGVLGVPAGAGFQVQREPAGLGGQLVAGGDGRWERYGGEVSSAAQGMQTCRAPAQAGYYRLEWADHGHTSHSSGGLNVLVLEKAELHTQGDRTTLKVDGKSLGTFLDAAGSPVRRVRENAALYQIPRYFARLTPETIDLQLGTDFTLGQLVAFKDYRNAEGRKVYTTERHTDLLPLRPELIDKLNKLRDRLRQKKVKVTRFWITSGFRAPEYNHAIGGAAYSRHCYGDAVDLVIDEDGDKRMDDLNGDGKIDRFDGIVIGNACRELELEGAVVPGGIGVYEWGGDDSVLSHVHIDCRGYISRWGQVGAGKGKKTFTWWPKAEFQEEENGE